MRVPSNFIKLRKVSPINSDRAVYVYGDKGRKKGQTLKKMSQAPEDYTKENIQMGKRHTTKYSTPTVIKVIKTEAMRFCHTVARWGRMMGLTKPNVGEEVK